MTQHNPPKARLPGLANRKLQGAQPNLNFRQSTIIFQRVYGITFLGQPSHTATSGNEWITTAILLMFFCQIVSVTSEMHSIHTY